MNAYFYIGKYAHLKYADMKKLLSLVSFLLMTVLIQAQSSYNKPYINQLPLDVMERALSQRQAQYNRNYGSFRSKAQDVDNLSHAYFEKLKRSGKAMSESRRKYLLSFYEEVNKLNNWDFSNNTNYYNAMDYLNRVQRTIQGWMYE